MFDGLGAFFCALRPTAYAQAFGREEMVLVSTHPALKRWAFLWRPARRDLTASGVSEKSKDPPGQNQAGWAIHFKIVCCWESRRVGHPPGYLNSRITRLCCNLYCDSGSSYL